MNVISSNTGVGLNVPRLPSAGAGNVGEGLLLFQVYCCCLVLMMLARPRESSPFGSVPTCPCPQRAVEPSLNILNLCGKIQNMLSKREVNSNCYTTLPPRLQGMGKNLNVSHAKGFTSTKQKSENIPKH